MDKIRIADPPILSVRVGDYHYEVNRMDGYDFLCVRKKYQRKWGIHTGAQADEAIKLLKTILPR